MPTSSPLQPIDLRHVEDQEREDKANWLVRHLVGSITGRITISTFESLRASSVSIVCLSPWGDSSPLLLPCIRFRDLALHTVVAATGGTAVVAAPFVGPVADTIIGTVGDSLLVDTAILGTFDLGTKIANDGLAHVGAKLTGYNRTKVCTTTSVKTLTVTIKYKHLPTDAQLGFFRASGNVKGSADLEGIVSSMKEYLSVAKGWFSPFLFSSGRRPVIPRKLNPDIVFSHGPFVQGDYELASTLLHQSASVLALCADPDAKIQAHVARSASTGPEKDKKGWLDWMDKEKLKGAVDYEKLKGKIDRTVKDKDKLKEQETAEGAKSDDEEKGKEPEKLTEEPQGEVITLPKTRRLLVTVVGLQPHRLGLWTSSQRPSECILKYSLLNGVPTLVLPARSGCPLQSWDTQTLHDLHKIKLTGVSSSDKDGQAVPESERAKWRQGKFGEVVNALFEFLGLCVDWERIQDPDEVDHVAPDSTAPMVASSPASTPNASQDSKSDIGAEEARDPKKDALLRDAIELLVEGAVRSGIGKQAGKALEEGNVDPERAGIVMFRMI